MTHRKKLRAIYLDEEGEKKWIQFVQWKREREFGSTHARSIGNWVREFVRINVRWMLLFVGGAMLAQVAMPWTNRALDNLAFIVMGSVLLGFAVPGRLWK